METPKTPRSYPAKRALTVLGSLLLALWAPQGLAANCPSGATMVRGKCTCPSGKVPSLDGRRCVEPPKKSEKERTKTKSEPKIKGEPAKGDSIPSGAKIRILSITKEDPFYDIRSQLLGKEGVVYPDPMSKVLSAPKTGAGLYQGTINIDGIDWYFYQVSISLLDFGATPTKKSVAYGEFVPGGSTLTLKDVSTSDLSYYKTNIKKLGGQKCTVSAGGLVPNGGAYYSGEVTCGDGKVYYFLGFTFTLDAGSAPKTTSTCDPSAYINTAAPLIAGQRVKVLDISSLDPLYADRKSIIGKEGYVTSAMALYNTCFWEGTFTADDGTFYSFYEAQLKDLGKSISAACVKDSSTAKSLLGGQKVKILEVGPGDPTYADREKWKGKIGLVSGDLLNMGGCWFDGGVTVDGGVYTYFSQIQVQELSPPPPTPACSADASKINEFKEGLKVTVLEIAPIDLYYGERAKWIGQSGKVTLSLLKGVDCWYGGEITFDSGEVRYFASIQVKELSTSTSASGNLSKLKAYTGTSIAVGTAVTILDVSSSDIFYNNRSTIIGKTCKVADASMLSAGSGWFSGQLNCGDGTSYSFAQVSVMLATGDVKLPAKSTVTKYTGKSIKKGTALQIIEIASEDVFFGQRDSIVGKSGCSASEDLTSSETGWFTGGVSCSDGKSYSFFKVSVGLTK